MAGLGQKARPTDTDDLAEGVKTHRPLWTADLLGRRALLSTKDLPAISGSQARLYGIVAEFCAELEESAFKKQSNQFWGWTA